MKYKYYLSGAITGQTNFKNYFDGFEKQIKKWTDEPIFNPTAIDLGEHALWEDYMRYDLRELMESESLVLLPNWRKSTGARVEVDTCEKLNIPVIKFNNLIRELKEKANAS